MIPATNDDQPSLFQRVCEILRAQGLKLTVDNAASVVTSMGYQCSREIRRDWAKRFARMQNPDRKLNREKAFRRALKKADKPPKKGKVQAEPNAGPTLTLLPGGKCDAGADSPEINADPEPMNDIEDSDDGRIPTLTLQQAHDLDLPDEQKQSLIAALTLMLLLKARAAELERIESFRMQAQASIDRATPAMRPLVTLLENAVLRARIAGDW